MPDETNEDNTKGEESNSDTEKGEETLSDLEKLKASNDAFEKELIRGRELKAERLEQEAQKLVGGKATTEAAPDTSKETSKEYRDRIDKEISEGRHAD